MGYAEIAKGIAYPNGATDRYKRLDAYERLLNGRIYDELEYPFDVENEGGDYIPMSRRRPNLRFNSAAIITDQLCGLLWSDEQQPRVCTRDPADDDDQDNQDEKKLAKIVRRLNLMQHMDRAFRRGQPGSVAISLRVLPDGSPLIRVIRGKHAKPVYDPLNPNRLVGLIQVYPLTPDDLEAQGYPDVDRSEKAYWMRIEYDGVEERRFRPMRDTDYQRIGDTVDGVRIAWQLDAVYPHAFGEVPVVWIRNLNDEYQADNDPDGPATYGMVAENMVALDYSLSQINRGYRYTADPMLAVNQGEMLNSSLQPIGEIQAAVTDNNGNLVKTPTNVIPLGPGGTAEMIEITGQGLAAFGEFLKIVREWTLEVMSGNKADSEHTKGAMSGRALDILHRALRLLKTRQRVAYGDLGLVPLLRLILVGIERAGLSIKDVEGVSSDTIMRLEWPTEDTPDENELVQLANAAETLAGGSPQAPAQVLPLKAVVRLVCSRMGLPDVNEILTDLEAERAQKQAEQAQLADADADRQIKVAASKPQPAPPSNPARSGKE